MSNMCKPKNSTGPTNYRHMLFQTFSQYGPMLVMSDSDYHAAAHYTITHLT